MTATGRPRRRRAQLLLRRAAAAPIRFYRRFVSPLKPTCCRFSPSCSEYAIVALRKRGVLMGVVLTAWRILRCHPLCAPGFDPVPDRRRR